MHLAFYAPLKAPDHPVPSGDRTMARGVVAALEYAGHRVDQTSDLRIYDKIGDPQAQAGLFSQAQAEVARILALPDASVWSAWVTYHNYYKAPDLIGPAVSQQLGIPYFQIEATRARKRLTGPWARFAEAAERASDRARAIFYFTAQDAEALHRDAPAGQQLVHLKPFLVEPELPPCSTRDGPILAVGMMRPGDKLASYALISQTLPYVTGDWRLDIVGDGPARPEVEAMMARFGDRIRLLGQLDKPALSAVYGRARALFWPGVNEAFGLAYLEAQAAGVPVVAQDRPGVRDVVHGGMACVDAGPQALAKRLEHLLSDGATTGDFARQQIAKDHLMPAAATTLTDGIGAAS